VCRYQSIKKGRQLDAKVLFSARTHKGSLMANRGPYHDVRALNRGLKILEVLSQAGWIKPGALSALSGIDRSSTYRLLNTLVDSGYVLKRSDDGSFALTSKINLIADGFTQTERICQVVAPHLHALTKEILWPSDFAILLRGEVKIVESTHRMSPMSIHRAMIGKERSLTRSALGQAILSALSDDELDITINVVTKLGGADSIGVRNRTILTKTAGEVRARGYAAVAGGADPKISAIALPVRAPESAIGAVNIIFFRSAMTLVQAADRYLANLRTCVERIERDLSSDLLNADLR
jgi:IclR family mhp operon transcriptional activator